MNFICIALNLICCQLIESFSLSSVWCDCVFLFCVVQVVGPWRASRSCQLVGVNVRVSNLGGGVVVGILVWYMAPMAALGSVCDNVNGHQCGQWGCNFVLCVRRYGLLVESLFRIHAMACAAGFD